MEGSERLTELLEEINDNQKRLLEQQNESLQLQRQQMQLLHSKSGNSDELYDAHERFQRRGNLMMDRTRSLFLLIIFLLVLLLIFASWALFI